MAFDKIILSGNQICDYLYIQTEKPGEDDFLYVNDEPSKWNDSTLLFANFNDSEHILKAGNSEIIGKVSGYEVRRKKYNQPYSEYVGTIRDAGRKFLVDYSVKNNVDYTYYLHPALDDGKQITPLVTKQASIDCPYWSLFIVDETDEDNIYYLDKMFKFELNLEVGEMSNNAQVTIVQNFTPYPTVQYGNSNYWSGSLSSMCGFISSNGIDYVQKENMIHELKSITSDTRKMFLKDICGNLWQVKISAPVNIETQYVATRSLKTLKFSWVEVNDTEGVVIINNPNKPIVDWVITETGEALPYKTYVWDDNLIWDNSYLWTAHTETDFKRSNLGRNIKDGD